MFLLPALPGVAPGVPLHQVNPSRGTPRSPGPPQVVTSPSPSSGLCAPGL